MRPPPGSTRTDTLCPYTTLFRTGRRPPRRQRLFLIACGRPVVGPVAPVSGPGHLPGERRLDGQPPDRPAEIAGVLGGKAQLAAVLQHPRELRHRGVLDEAPLLLDPLRPGVGPLDEDPVAHPIR